MQLAAAVLNLSAHFLCLLRPKLSQIHPDLLNLPPHLLGPSTHEMPTPIIPIMTKYPRPLSTFLLAHGMNARPITWPTVPKGKDRVRVCLHAGNKTGDVEMLVEVILQWAEEAQRTWLFDQVGQSKL
jgi:8-amino-7-oxononanoate synthase